MAWTFNSDRFGSIIVFRIGNIQIAKVQLVKAEGGKWVANLHFMDGSMVPCPDVKAALSEIHNRLNSPPSEATNGK